MRRFLLVRDIDRTGISGTGVVAEGAASQSGQAVLFWLTRVRSVGFYKNMAELLSIHGHEGATRIEWLDDLH